MNGRSGSPRYTSAKLQPKDNHFLQNPIVVNTETYGPDYDEFKAVNFLTQSRHFPIKNLDTGEVRVYNADEE